MLFCMLAFIALLFFLFRGRFGPRFGRGPWGAGWGHQPPTSTDGQPAQPQAWMGPWGQQAPQPRPEDDALKVLADRLASGDISPDEYLQRVSVLRQQP